MAIKSTSTKNGSGKRKKVEENNIEIVRHYKQGAI